MSITPLAGKLITLSVLFLAWMICYERVKRLDAGQPYHVAADRRDRRKARFYYLSVWGGISVAFLSFLCLDALSSAAFDSASSRELLLGITRWAGIGGLTVVALVWTQVGSRVGQANSDGKALLAVKETSLRQNQD